MKDKIEVLLSAMNIENKEQYKKILQNNNITGSVTVVNQVERDKELLKKEEGQQLLYSDYEKGVSKSRNKLMEKARGDILVFADDDTIYKKDYEKIIAKEYEKNKEADVIIFCVENVNSKREKTKRIGNKKMNLLDVMRVRTSEITLKKETLCKLKKQNIKFDLNFGPGGIFQKGEETIFIADILKNGWKVYSVNKKIGIVKHEKSTWFTGYHDKFLYDQGAIFYRIAPKWYPLLNIQYAIRKYFLYKDNLNMVQAYQLLNCGAKKCKNIMKRKQNG